MNKMLVAVFDNENKAFEGLTALKDLHKKGDITLYASAVVSKTENGELKLNTAADQGPVGTATGLFTGSLIGLLGGPVGLAVGALAGMFAGMVYDVKSDDINSGFLDEVSNALTNGKTAVIAEVDESWTVPVDTRMTSLNAMVFRRLKYEVEDEQLARESEAIEQEFKDLKEEFKQAREEDKAAIKSAMNKLEKKANAINDRIKTKLNESQKQFNAKLSTIQNQMKDARERRKAKLEKRISEMKEEYGLRTQKLKQASSLITEAFSPKPEIKKTEKAALL